MLSDGQDLHALIVEVRKCDGLPAPSSSARSHGALRLTGDCVRLAERPRPVDGSWRYARRDEDPTRERPCSSGRAEHWLSEDADIYPRPRFPFLGAHGRVRLVLHRTDRMLPQELQVHPRGVRQVVLPSCSSIRSLRCDGLASIRAGSSRARARLLVRASRQQRGGGARFPLCVKVYRSFSPTSRERCCVSWAVAPRLEALEEFRGWYYMAYLHREVRPPGTPAGGS